MFLCTPYQIKRPKRVYAPSSANVLPFELVERILLQLTYKDLVLAFPDLPLFWRQVIQNSTPIREVLLQGKRPIITTGLCFGQSCGIDHKHWKLPGISVASAFDEKLDSGQLYVDDLVNGAETMVFVPFEDDAAVVLVDATRTLRAYKSPTRRGSGYIVCYNHEGRLVCAARVVWMQPYKPLQASHAEKN
jgi:hypothetical protein